MTEKRVYEESYAYQNIRLSVEHCENGIMMSSFLIFVADSCGDNAYYQHKIYLTLPIQIFIAYICFSQQNLFNFPI